MFLATFISLISISSLTPDQINSSGLNKNNPKDQKILEKCLVEADESEDKITYYDYTIKDLRKYFKLKGQYPLNLDSLSILDSVDRSFMTTAWKLDYIQEDSGKSYSIDGYDKMKLEGFMSKDTFNKKDFEAFLQTLEVDTFKKCVNEEKSKIK